MTTPSGSAATDAGYRAAILAIAPAVFMLGSVYHPWIGSPGDAGFLDTLAATVAADPTRWAVAHLVIAVGSALLILAFLALRSQLREAGEDRWSALGLPLVVVGSTLYALLPAMEFGPVGAVLAGADAAAIQASLMPWFVPILVSAAAIFALGVLGFVFGIVRSGILSPGLTRIVVAALFVMALSRFFPVGAAQLYVGPAGGIVALWPLAWAIRKRTGTRTAVGPEPAFR